MYGKSLASNCRRSRSIATRFRRGASIATSEAPQYRLFVIGPNYRHYQTYNSDVWSMRMSQPQHCRCLSTSTSASGSRDSLEQSEKIASNSDANRNKIGTLLGKASNTNRAHKRIHLSTAESVSQFALRVISKGESTPTKDPNQSPSMTPAEHAHQIADDILNRNKDSGSSTMSISSMKSAVDSIVCYWSKAKSRHDIEKGAKLLRSVLDEYTHLHNHIDVIDQTLDMKLLNKIILSFLINSKRWLHLDTFATLATDLLHHFEQISDEAYSMSTNNHDTIQNKPSRKLYNVVMDAVAKSGRRDAIHTIQAMIERIQHPNHVGTDTISYNCLLYAHSQDRRDLNAAKKCEDLLRLMEQIESDRCGDNGEYQHMNVDMEVGQKSYNIVLNAWAKSSIHRRHHREISDDRGYHRHHVSMKKNEGYSTGLSPIYSYSANRAEMILCQMQERQMRPSVVSFTTVIDAWSKVADRDIDAALRAEDIFHMMDELSSGASGRNSTIVSGSDQNCNTPTHIDYSHLRPNALTFSAVMNAWANSSRPGAATRAEALLIEMIRRYDEHGDVNVRPTKISFAICIKAWARRGERGSFQKAMALLEKMIEMQTKQDERHPAHGRRGERKLSPDVGLFDSLLRTLANDSDEEENKATKAESILQRMRNIGIKPNLTTYNNILRCCCTTRSNNTETRQKAVRIATETLLQIQKTKKILPDPYTFNFFIKVCDRLTTGKEKFKLIHVAFRYCIKAGQFSFPVWSIMRNSLTPDELKTILDMNWNYLNSQQHGDQNRREEVMLSDLHTMKVSDFPKEWSSVKDSHRQ